MGWLTELILGIYCGLGIVFFIDQLFFDEDR